MSKMNHLSTTACICDINARVRCAIAQEFSLKTPAIRDDLLCTKLSHKHCILIALTNTKNLLHSITTTQMDDSLNHNPRG